MNCIKGIETCNQPDERVTTFLEKLLKGACKGKTEIPVEILCSTLLSVRPEDRLVAETRTQLYVEPGFSVRSLLENLGSK